MKKAKIFAIAVIAAMGLSSCVKETVESSDYQAKGSGISFTFTKPVGAYVQTYADIASAAEWAINTLDVYAFKSDGTFVGKLGTSDYTESVTDHTTTITMNQTWVNNRIGSTFRFYFVANDAASTGGEHIGTFSGNEAAFKALATKALAVGSNGKYVNIGTPLLFTGVSDDVTVSSGKVSEEVQIKRRVARFDVVNEVPAKIVIKEVLISGARQQGYIWADAGAGKSPADFAQVSMEPINVSAMTAVNDTYESAFYLYPTSLDQTTLVIVAELDGGVAKMYEITSPTAIAANKRYKLVCKTDSEASDIEFIVEAQDWDDVEEPIEVDVDTPKAEAGVSLVSVTSDCNQGGTLYPDNTVASPVSVVVSSTHGTDPVIVFSSGASVNFTSTLEANDIIKTSSSTTYASFITEETYTFNVPTGADQSYDMVIKFVSKGDAKKSKDFHIVYVTELKAVANILAYDATAGLNLDGIGTPLHFKYGSLIGIAAKPNDLFDAEDVVYAPEGYDISGLKATLQGIPDSDPDPKKRWTAIPYTASGAIQDNNLSAGTGDPCKLISSGSYKMPTGNPYNEYKDMGIWTEKEGIPGRLIGDQLYIAGGYRKTNGQCLDMGRFAQFWSATPRIGPDNFAYYMNAYQSNVVLSSSTNPAVGMLIRCVPVE